jgi:streptogramin lyase
MLRRSLFALVVASLTACAGGMGTLPGPATGQTAAAKGSLKASFRIRIPKRRHAKHGAKYVSPATKALTLAIFGPTGVPSEVVGLTPTSSGCSSTLASTQCALTVPGLKPCPTAANCYSANVATYDGYDAANNTIPGTANMLSAAQAVAFHVALGQPNTIAITLGGIPASAVLVPSDAALTGNAAGYTVSKCLSSTKVSVIGVDADGNYILGAGAPVPSLVSNDPAHLAVSTPATASPNLFTLTRPSIPAPNSLVTLTAKVLPVSGSGGAPASAAIPVTFNYDICGVITEFPVTTANSGVFGITAGADGNLWFTESQAGQIGRITTAGVVTEFSTASTSTAPKGIALGPDGNVWFAENADAANSIGKITTAGAVTEYPVTTLDSTPFVVTAGPDNAMWFTEVTGNNIGRITTAGTVSEYPVLSAGSFPQGITKGPDGVMWFTELCGNNIGSISITGTVAEFPVPTGTAGPYDIAAGPAGDLWFTEDFANKIARSTTGGTISEFPIPTSNSNPHGITAGPDGNMWFVEKVQQRVGRITPDGTITEFLPPSAGTAVLEGITAGPDGNLWFTEANANRIARIQ